MYTLIVGQSCSGKTTLARRLSQYPNILTFLEPEDTECTFYPLFLDNPRKYAFANQLEFMDLLLLNEQRIANSYSFKLVFQETGFIACHNVYNMFLREQGLLSPSEFDALSRRYSEHVRECPLPERIVYLTAKTVTLTKRAFARDGICTFTPEQINPFWEKLVQMFEVRGTPILRLDTDKEDEASVYAAVKRWIG